MELLVLQIARREQSRKWFIGWYSICRPATCSLIPNVFSGYLTKVDATLQDQDKLAHSCVRARLEPAFLIRQTIVASLTAQSMHVLCTLRVRGLHLLPRAQHLPEAKPNDSLCPWALLLVNIRLEALQDALSSIRQPRFTCRLVAWTSVATGSYYASGQLRAFGFTEFI